MVNSRPCSRCGCIPRKIIPIFIIIDGNVVFSEEPMRWACPHCGEINKIIL